MAAVPRIVSMLSRLERAPSSKAKHGSFAGLVIGLTLAFVHILGIGRVSCERYPGIETNYLQDIARMDASCVCESISAAHEFGFEGAALCWNAMEAPREHIEAITALR